MRRLSESEAGFQGALLELAEVTGWTQRYHTHDSRHSAAGFPDLVLIRPPELIVAELKRDGQKPTPAQLSWCDALERCGVEVHVWRPADWHDIEERLHRRSRRDDSTRIAPLTVSAYTDAVARIRDTTKRPPGVHNGAADQYASALRQYLAHLGVDVDQPDQLRAVVGVLDMIGVAVALTGTPPGVTIGRSILAARVLTETHA